LVGVGEVFGRFEIILFASVNGGVKFPTFGGIKIPT
jgi:hypothetical protein